MKTNIDFKKLDVVVVPSEEEENVFSFRFVVPQEWKDIVDDESKSFYTLPLIVRMRMADGGYYYQIAHLRRKSFAMDNDTVFFDSVDLSYNEPEDRELLEYYRNGGVVEVGVIDYFPVDYMCNVGDEVESESSK